MENNTSPTGKFPAIRAGLMSQTQPEGGKRARRSSSERQLSIAEKLQAKIEKDQRALNRINSLKEQATKRLVKDQHRLESTQLSITELKTRKTISKESLTPSVALKVSKDLSNALTEISKKYNISLETDRALMTNRGIFNMKIRGTKEKSARQHIEVTRWNKNAENIGLGIELLNSEVMVAGEMYLLQGLKGRDNDVVLQRLDTLEILRMPVEEFKSKLNSPAAINE